MTSPVPSDVQTDAEPEVQGVVPDGAPAAEECDGRAFAAPPEVERDAAASHEIWRPRPGLIGYALRGYGPTLVLAGTLALGATRFTVHVAEVVGPMGVGLVVVAALAIVSYALWWFMEVHEDSADDHHRVPQWPDPADFEGMMSAAGNWLTAIFFAALPLLVVLVLDLSWMPTDLLLLLAGLTYLPLALSGVLSPSKAIGGLPHAVVLLIGKDPLSFFISVGFALACIPTIVTRSVWDAPIPVDLVADALVSFVLLVTLRRVGLSRAA